MHEASVLELRVLLVDLPEELLNSYVLALLLGCANQRGIILEIDVDLLIGDGSLFGGWELLVIILGQHRISLLAGQQLITLWESR